jgi:hypothetical protein
MKAKSARRDAPRPALTPSEQDWLDEHPPEAVAAFWSAVEVAMARDPQHARGHLLAAGCDHLGGWPL